MIGRTPLGTALVLATGSQTLDSVVAIMIMVCEIGDGVVCKGRLPSNQATFERQ
jgi:hypothetical protein